MMISSEMEQMLQVLLNITTSHLECMLTDNVYSANRQQQLMLRVTDCRHRPLATVPTTIVRTTKHV